MVRVSCDYIEACSSFHPHSSTLAGPYTAWRPRRCFSSLAANFQFDCGNGEMRFTQGHD